ncbi:hypothetical protein Aduo_005912 [Ancylostoma duodenale]
MDDDDYDRHFRLLICGGSGTGKSSLLSSFSFEGGGSEGTSVLKLDDENIRIDIRKKDKWQREYVSEFDAVVVVFAADDFKPTIPSPLSKLWNLEQFFEEKIFRLSVCDATAVFGMILQ